LLLLLLALLGATALLSPAFANASSTSADRYRAPGDEPVNEVALTESSEAATPGFAENVNVDDETQMVGIKWNGAAATEFTVEVQEADGSWTAPYAVEGMDIGPDDGTAESRKIAERRGTDYASDPVSVADPAQVRVRVTDGLATDVEFVTIGGDAAQPTDEPTPPPSTAPPSTTTAPSPSTGPPSTNAEPPTPSPSLPDPPIGPEATQASTLTWAGIGMLGVAGIGWLLLHRSRLRRAGLLVIIGVMALVTSGCFGGSGGQATHPPPWPGVFGRAHWGAPDGAPCSGYTSNVRFAVVHHTGGGPQDNNYSNPAAKIHGIYQYHLATGYCDIAYNFLVDKWGTLWEGRAGGVDQSVMGAHTLSYNSESTGVAILGDFTSVNAPGPAQDGLVRLLAWKLWVHHVDPYSAVWKNGGWIQPISAHRELGSTSCPGNVFYPELPRLRNAIAARVFYGSPVGNFEAAWRNGGGVRVAGWALDPDTFDGTGIHVYVGNNGYGAVANNAYRGDIANLYPGYGPWHGFDHTFPVPAGPSQVCVYAINVGPGAPVFLGCRTV
jgi:hypothetical protein